MRIGTTRTVRNISQVFCVDDYFLCASLYIFPPSDGEDGRVLQVPSGTKQVVLTKASHKLRVAPRQAEPQDVFLSKRRYPNRSALFTRTRWDRRNTTLSQREPAQSRVGNYPRAGVFDTPQTNNFLKCLQAEDRGVSASFFLAERSSRKSHTKAASHLRLARQPTL